MKGRAIVTGVSGQDGFYLARHLIMRGYEVVGTGRPTTAPRSPYVVDGQDVPIRPLELTDAVAFEALLKELRPTVVANLAARASSAQLFDDPIATAEVNGVAVIKMLEAVRKVDPAIRFCQASSSEVFAGAVASPQSEETLRAPTSAYGAAKAFADHAVAAYRATHGLFACSAILYPHESPRRDAHFLVRKVVRAAVHIARGKAKTVELGDLDAVRDWGFAGDYMRAVADMLSLDAPRDFVLASGVPHTVEDVCRIVFAELGLDWREHVVVAASLRRGGEPVPRVGDPTRARTELAFTPSFSFSELLRHMVDAEQANDQN